jgi:hypothetical protein
MTDDYFIRIGERSWITMSTQSHAALHEIRYAIKNHYYQNVLIHTIEDVVYAESANMQIRDAVEQMLRNGVNSVPYQYTQPKFFFIQLTFLTDADNAEFIMNKPEIIMNKCQQANFHNYV